MTFKKKLFNEEELLKNMIGGVEEVAKKGAPEPKNSGNKTVIIIIIGIIVFFAVIISIIVILFTVKSGPIHERRLRWNELRCGGTDANRSAFDKFLDSLVCQYPGFFGPKGMTFKENKAFCDAEIIENANKTNMKPMQNQLNQQNSMIDKINKQMANQNKMIKGIRDNFMAQIKEVQQKLYNLYRRLAYLFKVFARLFYKIFTVFRDIFMVLKYSIWTLTSMWNGPIGNTVRVLCFGEETLLQVVRNENNILTKISEVQINDIINNSVVIGVCKFLKQDGNQFYRIDNINVSGSHLIEYNNKLIRVKDHPDAVPVEYQREYVYSLITSNGKMKIMNNLFRDHLGDNTLETYQNFVNPIYKKNILENIDKERYNDSAINLYPGFTSNSYLTTNNGIKKAEDVEIGELIDGKKIIGVVRYRLEGKTFITSYNIDNDHSGFLVGIQLYKKNDYEIGELDERWILGKLECIGLLVEGAIVKVNDKIKVADFDIVSDELRDQAEEAIA